MSSSRDYLGSMPFRAVTHRYFGNQAAGSWVVVGGWWITLSRGHGRKPQVANRQPPWEVPVQRSRVHAVVTDVHFWIPVVVLALGATLLLVLGRS